MCDGCVWPQGALMRDNCCYSASTTKRQSRSCDGGRMNLLFICQMRRSCHRQILVLR